MTTEVQKLEAQQRAEIQLGELSADETRRLQAALDDVLLSESLVVDPVAIHRAASFYILRRQAAADMGRTVLVASATARLLGSLRPT